MVNGSVPFACGPIKKAVVWPVISRSRSPVEGGDGCLGGRVVASSGPSALCVSLAGGLFAVISVSPSSLPFIPPP
ncbi:unnamed protein product [Prunus armeniaca]|uniref:Uncharacterized protein n=1 Tax=Prunus armeniaca TaxID=36596 RepID=A0A6J5TQZ5_PRUAR|nr:unnamed protein product [Prunus armeniaca]